MRSRGVGHPGRVLFGIVMTVPCMMGFAARGAEQWLNSAEEMPPELAADVLIRAANAGAPVIADSERARVLARAFELASQAREPFGWVGRLDRLRESRTRYIILSAGMGISRLALQCRVIRKMLDSDPMSARRLLETVELPALPVPSCGEPLLADVSDYYETARAVLAHPDAGGNAAAFIDGLLNRISSPVQLAPAARLLAQSSIGNGELNRLVVEYVERLRGVRSADPAFRFAVVGQGLTIEIEALARKCRANSDLTASLLFAFRDFVAAHLTGPGCHESFLPEARREIWAAAVDPFNQRLRVPGGLTRDGLPPLDINEMWPSDADNATPAVQGFWQHDEADSWRTRLFAENSAPDGGAAEREPDLTEMAYRFSIWPKPAEMDDEDFFHQKLLLYRRLARIVPAGAKRQDVIGGLVAFVEGDPMQSRAPAEWLWHVVSLMQDDLLREEVLQAMEKTRNPALRAYAELDRQTSPRLTRASPAQPTAAYPANAAPGEAATANR